MSEIRRCLYCCTTDLPPPKDEDDVGVCTECALDQRAAYESEKIMRRYKARLAAGEVFGTNCKSCGEYISRRTWKDDVKPVRCYICNLGHERKIWYEKYGAEWARIRAEEEAAAPAIIEAMRAVLLRKE